MKAAVVILVSVLALAVAEPPSGYSSPSFGSLQQGGNRRQGGGADSGYGAPEHEAQTHKNVYVFSAPDEPEDRQSNTIRVPGGDKHVNVIFVKTPSSSSSHQTEVVLPEQDEHKSLVYVLLKKGSSSSDVKIRRPAPKEQQKPEVHFIRYGDQQQGYQGGQGGQGPSAGVPSNAYGTNF